MRKIGKSACIPVIPALLLMLLSPLFGAQANGQEGIMVGRVSYTEGEVLSYVPDDNDWVVIVKDIPFGFDDALYAGDDGKAEITMPNNTSVRIGSNSQLQMIALKNDVTEVDLSTGMGRFYNRSRDAVVKVTTPFGYVVADPDSSFDLYVGDESAEVIALDGYVDFVQGNDEARYEVIPGSTSVLADATQIAAGDGNVNADWDDWNAERDSFREKRLAVKGDSVRYLPSTLQEDAPDLDQNGTWEDCTAGGVSKPCWAPKEPDYQPYQDGEFVSYRGDQCFVPKESTGYVTHHYGRWFLEESCGCYRWLPPEPPPPPPPVVYGEPPPPPVDCGCCGACFYPAQVIFAVTAGVVGWCVPPLEVPILSCCNRWGHNTVIVDNSVHVTNIINQHTTIIESDHFRRHGIVVERDRFHSRDGYRHHKGDPRKIVDKWDTGRDVNKTLRGDPKISSRFTDRNPSAKPGDKAIQRISHNASAQGRGPDRTGVSSKAISQDLAKVRGGQVRGDTRVKPPTSTSRLTKPGDADKARVGAVGGPKNLKGDRVRSSLDSSKVRPQGVGKPEAGSRKGTPGLGQRQVPGSAERGGAIRSPRTGRESLDGRRSPRGTAEGSRIQPPREKGPRTPGEVGRGPRESLDGGRRTPRGPVEGSRVQPPQERGPRTPGEVGKGPRSPRGPRETRPGGERVTPGRDTLQPPQERGPRTPGEVGRGPRSPRGPRETRPGGERVTPGRETLQPTERGGRPGSRQEQQQQRKQEQEQRRQQQMQQQQQRREQLQQQKEQRKQQQMQQQQQRSQQQEQRKQQQDQRKQQQMQQQQEKRKQQQMQQQQQQQQRKQQQMQQQEKRKQQQMQQQQQQQQRRQQQMQQQEQRKQQQMQQQQQQQQRRQQQMQQQQQRKQQQMQQQQQQQQRRQQQMQQQEQRKQQQEQRKQQQMQQQQQRKQQQQQQQRKKQPHQQMQQT